jgi:hypothetical protein
MKPPLKDLTPAARIFAEFLRKNCRGREAAMPKWRVLPELRRTGLDLSSRDYDELPELALDLGYDTGTWRKGAFWMVTETDFLAAQANLLVRFGPMRSHHEKYERRRRERFPDLPLLEAARAEREQEILTAENAEVEHA